MSTQPLFTTGRSRTLTDVVAVVVLQLRASIGTIVEGLHVCQMMLHEVIVMSYDTAMVAVVPVGTHAMKTWFSCPLAGPDDASSVAEMPPISTVVLLAVGLPPPSDWH
jgi:hypothetical protein